MSKSFDEAMVEMLREQERAEAEEKERRRKEFVARVAEVDARLHRYLPRRRVKPIGES
jgi:hypothetical protein